jgi:hypothetical protein
MTKETRDESTRGSEEATVKKTPGEAPTVKRGTPEEETTTTGYKSQQDLTVPPYDPRQLEDQPEHEQDPKARHSRRIPRVTAKEMEQRSAPSRQKEAEQEKRTASTKKEPKRTQPGEEDPQDSPYPTVRWLDLLQKAYQGEHEYVDPGAPGEPPE